MSLSSKTLTAIYWLFSIIFIFTLNIDLNISFLIKSVPALIMSAYLFKNQNYILAIGFIFSAFGDIFLDIDRQNFFIHGLASFLVAHLFYSFSFLKNREFQKENLPFIGLIVLIALVMAYILIPKLGSLTIPVIIYLVTIAFMGICASLNRTSNFLLPLGAVIFMISDSLIAIDKFLLPLAWSKYAIMITYFSANYLIGTAFNNKN